jgi:hypothetical protein
MGYRSDVTTLIYGDGLSQEKYDLLKTLMNTTFKGVYDEFEANAEWHDHKRALEFRMENVKWYESYSDVQNFMQMLNDIGDMSGLNYEFIRVGEETDDIEQLQNGEDLRYALSVSRSIEVDL